MFRKLRWQLTLWFVLITMMVYAIAAFFGCLIFKVSMTQFVDSELTALTNELIPAIEVSNGQPNLQRWKKTVFKGPFRYLPMIQLYNVNADLIESYGPPGVPILFSRMSNVKRDIQEETYHIRVHSAPLRDENKLVGYLQLELSLKNVDGAIANFSKTMALIAPFLLLGFGLAGYFFSSKAAKPVEESFLVLQRFMADASHELNTPLSIILANSESIEADMPDNKNLKTRLDTLVRSAERMSALVGDLMLLAKMESTPVLNNPAVVNLDKILVAVIADFVEPFKGKSIRMEEGEIQPIQIYGDAEALKRLIANLLQNALKYTDSGGSVKASLTTADSEATLTIVDTGSGIAAENLDHIFDRFYRADASRSRAAGGSGLGLSIVKAIVEAHKGKVEVDSKLGAGTTLKVFLPIN